MAGSKGSGLSVDVSSVSAIAGRLGNRGRRCLFTTRLRLTRRGKCLQEWLSSRLYQSRMAYHRRGVRRRFRLVALRRIHIERDVGEFEFEIVEIEARFGFTLRKPVLCGLKRGFGERLRRGDRSDRCLCGNRGRQRGREGALLRRTGGRRDRRRAAEHRRERIGVLLCDRSGNGGRHLRRGGRGRQACSCCDWYYREPVHVGEQPIDVIGGNRVRRHGRRHMRSNRLGDGRLLRQVGFGHVQVNRFRDLRALGSLAGGSEPGGKRLLPVFEGRKLRRLGLQIGLHHIVALRRLRRQIFIAERQFEFTLQINRRIDILRRSRLVIGRDLIIFGSRRRGYRLTEHIVGKLCVRHERLCDRRILDFQHGLGRRASSRVLDKSAVGVDRRRPRRVIAVKGAQQLVFEVKGRIAPDRLLVSLQLLQLLNCWPSIVTDNAGKFAQRIIIGQFIEFCRPASCELFVCHSFHSQLLR
ncbi:hypothetical protein ABIA19_002026 [Sinorhizobium fredii]